MFQRHILTHFSHDPQISPNSGPLEGGTNITVMGSNLGVTRSDIVEVTINNVSCDVTDKSYQPGIGYEVWQDIQLFIMTSFLLNIALTV